MQQGKESLYTSMYFVTTTKNESLHIEGFFILLDSKSIKKFVLIPSTPLRYKWASALLLHRYN